MQFLKYSLVFLCCLMNVFAENGLQRYTLDDCLNINFDIKVKHASLPFGLLPMSVNVKKQSCVIDLELVRYFIWTDKWKIDVCRDPIHLKKGSSLDEILKKTMNCNFQAKDNAFCQEVKEISELIEDNLLIYADGEKENLDTDHGKSYCSFELIKMYLDRNKIYSRYDGSVNKNEHKFDPPKEEVPKIDKPKDSIMKKKIEKDTSEIIKEAQNPEIKIENTEPEEIKIPEEKIEI